MGTSRVPGAPGLDSETRESTNLDAVGFVLAGGQSRRMGRNKAFVEFEGRPLVEHAIRTLQAAGLAVHIAGAPEEIRSRLESCAPVVPDAAPGLGPLAGVCAGLRSTPAACAVFLPVDLPLLPSSLIQYLLRHVQITASAVTVVSVNGFVETFPVVLDRHILPVLESRLREGERGCLAAFRAAAAETGRGMSAVPVEVLVQSGQVAHPEALPPLRWFLNVNRDRDLGLASSMAIRRVS